jgi:hypothetical protein
LAFIRFLWVGHLRLITVTCKQYNRYFLSYTNFSGCHFSKEGVEEILNLQPNGSQAKAYQVKQVRAVILKYQLGG